MSEETTEAEGPQEEGALVEELIKEIVRRPDLAVKMIEAVTMIAKPWELLDAPDSQIGVPSVPPGHPAVQTLNRTHVRYGSGYVMHNILGKELAQIKRYTPQWSVSILGELHGGVPALDDVNKVKEFVEKKLREKGFIVA